MASLRDRIGRERGMTGTTSRTTAAAEGARRGGLVMQRRFTTPGTDPLDEVRYVRRDCVITNPDGSVVFELRDAEIPEDWSQLASDIAVSKYFRKAGIHGDPNRGERSVRELVYRVSHSIREAGERFGDYFASRDDADTFEAELTHLLVHQIAAFNSPVWFNCGLWHRYGIEGTGGNWAWDPATDAIVETSNAYERPQCSACFIQKVDDDLMAIFELVKNEARLFKYGSGTGTNFSRVRGKQEKLSGGGTSSGLMSFLEVFDRAAGSTKSGGTTRRAAKMVCLDLDHPEVVEFIEWKAKEEDKARALIAQGYPADFNGEAYHTVSGQNSNNSVRVTDDFMRAVEEDGVWQTRFRTDGRVNDTLRARDLWNKIGEAAWACADPGVQYDTNINAWHTCPNTDRINASNPCSEYMFLDDSACNLASINLTKFLGHDGVFDVEGYRHAVRTLITAMEILVDFASYPTRGIAQNSHDYRPLGLGYANLGTLLMRLGIPYDSDAGRGLCGALTAILCGRAYATSAEIASVKGPFPGFHHNREPMLAVMEKHRRFAYQVDEPELPGMVGDGAAGVPDPLVRAAREDWDDAVALGRRYGYRNAQATVLAPTGTIGLLMDCDTTGIEPDFALVKFKKLAGGGYFKIVNQSVPKALERLGYSTGQVADIVAHVTGSNTFTGAPHLSRSRLLAAGLTEDELARAEQALPTCFDVSSALAPWVLGSDAYERLGVPADVASAPGFSLPRHLGLTPEQVVELDAHVVGHMTIEGAPHLAPEHLPIFDCANRNGPRGQRFLHAMAHVRMMAAAQPFLSGAISKTVNLPNEATVDDVLEIYQEGWRLGLKAIALYRDGCKASQPLSTSSSKDGDDAQAGEDAAAADGVATKEAVEPGGVGPTEPAGAAAAIGAAIVPAPQHGVSPPKTVRHRLPKKRAGFTQEALVGGHKVFLRTGEYGDGSLGEIFVDMHKEGASFRSLMNCFAISVSLGLQHGVPLHTFVNAFTFTRFEPNGPVQGHPNVKFSTSIIDYVFRVLGVEYLKRYELAQVPPEEEQVELQNPTDVTAALRAEGVQATDPPPNLQPAQPELFGFDPAEPTAASAQTPGVADGARPTDALSHSLGEMMGDAPLCDVCGHITVRNGACYKCLNCGNSMGCS